MPDFEAAMETIDFYVSKSIGKPDGKMSTADLRLLSQRLNAIDILKEYLQAHWFESPPSDLIYNFIKKYKKINKLRGGDAMCMTIYKIAKEIFYYFI